ALTAMSVLLAPSSAALTGGTPGGPQGCDMTPGDTFEAPVVTPGTFATLFTDATIGPWTVTQNNVDLIGENFWQAADGVQSIDLSGSSGSGAALQGGVSRTFETDGLPLPLFTYVVTYCLAGNPYTVPPVKTGQVLVNGTPVQDFSFDVTGGAFREMRYRLETFSFTSSGPSAEVEFRNTTPTAFGPAIDKVTFKKCLLGLFCF
ncbi:MAG: DUF642 domain-containing protein, partial [Pseudonocardiaceae bacterium]